MWVKPASSGGAACWSMGSATVNQGWEMLTEPSTGTLYFYYWNGTTASGQVTIVSTISTGAWHYVLARNLTTTNRRISMLRPTGAVAHNQNTASVSPVALTKVGLGHFNRLANTDFYDGVIAEFFFATGDIDPDGSGGQLPDEFVRDLAYYGPWSMPNIVPLIEEYRSLRLGGPSREDKFGEVYQRGGIRPWTLVATPTLADHPPLMTPYPRANALYSTQYN